jgi:phage recombination protein Bet
MEVTKYQAGDNTVELTPDIIRKYLVSGQGKVTDQEIMMFIKLCEYQKLNPFLREVYLIKYGNDPATMVTGKETFLKRAYRHPKYKGHQTGISKDGETAWAEVYVAGYQVPIRCEVDYNEYVGRKRDGTLNKMWREKPRTMLKKVALCQSLREAFPEEYDGLYSLEETNTIDTPLPTREIGPESIEKEAEPKPEINAESLPEVEPVDNKLITDAQLKTLKKEIDERNIDLSMFLSYMASASKLEALERLEDIPRNQFLTAMAAAKSKKKPDKKVKEREPGEEG